MRLTRPPSDSAYAPIAVNRAYHIREQYVGGQVKEVIPAQTAGATEPDHVCFIEAKGWTA